MILIRFFGRLCSLRMTAFFFRISLVFIITTITIILNTSTMQAQMPQRIVSLAPSITHSVCILGKEANLIGITQYCPKGKTPKTVIGTIWEPNLEQIISLSPDLVIATKDSNKPGAVYRLQELGIRVHIVETVDTFESICDEFNKLAVAIDSEQQGKEIVADARQRLKRLAYTDDNLAHDRSTPKVFWQVGANPIYTVSRHSFINEFISRAGGVNIFAELPARYPHVSAEEVIRRAPDHIIIAEMDENANAQVAYWNTLSTIPAVKNDRVHYINDSLFMYPTPDTIATGAEMIAELLNKDTLP